MHIIKTLQIFPCTHTLTHLWGLLGRESEDSQKVNHDGPSSAYLIDSEQLFKVQRPVYSRLCKGARTTESSLNVCHLIEQKLKAEKQGDYTEKQNVQNQSMM